MKVTFEQQMASIKTKADLRAWVDDLPDGPMQGTIIVETNPTIGEHDHPDGAKCEGCETEPRYFYNNMGRPRMDHLAWLVYQYYLYLHGVGVED